MTDTGRYAHGSFHMVPEWLDDEKRMQDMVLSELDGRTRRLCEAVLSCDDGLPLLRFLAINAQTFLTEEDIAFNLGFSFSRVETCLRELIEMGLIKRIEVVGVVLFGLTDDAEMREAIDELTEWQNRWQTRLARLEHVIEGNVPRKQRGMGHG